ncbi:MAG: HAD family hydrolase [Promethearchaeota archaeon]
MANKLNIDNYKLIIFDMDGVILNIFNAIQQSLKDTLEKYKINIESEKYLGEIALLIEKLQAIPIPKIILNTKELITIDFLADKTVLQILRVAAYMYSQFKNYKENAEIYDGADRLIKYLTQKGKKLAMLSNNPRISVIESLEKFGLDKYFDLILGANDVGKLKPEPDGLIKIMKELGISNPKKVLFIGDMKTDIQAAKAATVHVAAIASGLNKKEELLSENPNFIFDDLKQFAKAIGLNL